MKSFAYGEAFCRLYKNKYRTAKRNSGLLESQSASTFVPEIDKRSKQLQRDEPIEDILYNDARRRKETSIQRDCIASSSTSARPHSPGRNDDILRRRLLRDIRDGLNLCDIQGNLSFSDFGTSNNFNPP